VPVWTMRCALITREELASDDSGASALICVDPLCGVLGEGVAANGFAAGRTSLLLLCCLLLASCGPRDSGRHRRSLFDNRECVSARQLV
jgi:hypothetical protein